MTPKDKNKISQKKRRDRIKNTITAFGCQSCGETHKGVLEVHHLAQEYKRFGRSQDMMYNLQDIRDNKAVVLCSNCHNKFHWHFGGKNQPFGTHTLESVLEVIKIETQKGG